MSGSRLLEEGEWGAEARCVGKGKRIGEKERQAGTKVREGRTMREKKKVKKETEREGRVSDA